MSLFERLFKRLHCTPCLAVAITTAVATCDGNNSNDRDIKAKINRSSSSNNYDRHNGIFATSASLVQEENNEKAGLIGAVGKDHFGLLLKKISKVK